MHKTKFGWMVPADQSKGVQGGWQPVHDAVTRLYNLGTEDFLFETLVTTAERPGLLSSLLSGLYVLFSTL